MLYWLTAKLIKTQLNIMRSRVDQLLISQIKNYRKKRVIVLVSPIVYIMFHIRHGKITSSRPHIPPRVYCKYIFNESTVGSNQVDIVPTVNIVCKDNVAAKRFP